MRFKVPINLRQVLGMAELARSLYTTDSNEARRRCLHATAWYRDVIEKLSRMTNPTRADLEEAARRYFAELEQVVYQPREYHPIYADQDLQMDIEQFQQRLDNLDMQFRANSFDGDVAAAAHDLANSGQFELDALPDELRRYAIHLSARVARAYCDRMLQFLKHPTKPFDLVDTLFAPPARRVAFESMSASTPVPTGPTLAEVGKAYLDRKIAQGVGQSQRTELARALGWLAERVGANLPLSAVTKPDLRTFRDDLRRLNGTLQGRKMPFDHRLTDDPEMQLKSVTARRYWTSIYSFFEWAAAEGFIVGNPAEGLKLELNKGETRDSPDPFSAV